MPAGKKMRSARGAIPFCPEPHPPPVAAANATTTRYVFTTEGQKNGGAQSRETEEVFSPPASERLRPLCSPYALCLLWPNVPDLYCLRTACAAARRAIGKRYGEQDT